MIVYIVSNNIKVLKYIVVNFLKLFKVQVQFYRFFFCFAFDCLVNVILQIISSHKYMNVVKCQDILGFGQPEKKTFWVDFKVKIYTQDPAIGVYEGHCCNLKQTRN